jgi:mono/diheme cytochrome c family protein
MLMRRLLLALAVVGVAGAAACVALAWRPALDAIAPPAASSFPAAQVAAGEQLAGAGNCASCHTAAGGAAWGGGLGLQTPFGLVYSPNISPDPQTGIGTWSVEAFARALREGVDRDGAHLYPAMPYTHFTKLRDEDIRAIYAFLMTRPAVVATERENTVPFPFSVRALQAGWKQLFFERGTYQDVAGKSAAWNRGAYLAEGLAHCAACHTPRNRFGAERRDAPYAGARIDGWLAPALDASNPAPLAWTEQDLYDYLRTGDAHLHGVAAGPMAGVVHDGLSHLPDADVRALAIWFAESNGSATRAPAAAAALSLAVSRRLVDTGKETQPGAQLYLAACASCHYTGAPTATSSSGGLALSTAIASDDPSNFIRTVMGGLGTGASGPYMPGFAGALTDDDIVQLAAYLRRTRSDRPPWKNLPAAVAAARPPLDATP